MKTIWKFSVRPAKGWQNVSAPVGAVPIHFDGENSLLWAEADSDNPSGVMKVGVWGTGWTIPDGAVHVNTYVGPTGWVWHLYRPAKDHERRRTRSE